jgi:hypothetical protein
VEAITNRLGTRFLVVTVVPNVLLVIYVGFLIAAGAPAHSPSFARAISVLDNFTIRQFVVILLIVLAVSVATHPLQIPLIQLVEGYWWGLPFGLRIADRFSRRFEDELNWARGELNRVDLIDEWDRRTEWSSGDATQRLYWLPSQEKDLLPTQLGNTLRTGETRAGKRYGLDLDVALPRLVPLISSPSITEVRDLRNQLDAAVRLCVAAGLATGVSVGLLLWHGPWLFMAVATYVLCWASYRAAVAAARDFCDSLAAAVDLNHLKLFDELQLPRPASLKEECDRNEVIGRLFRGGGEDVLAEQEMTAFRYIPPKADKQTGDQAAAPEEE